MRIVLGHIRTAAIKELLNSTLLMEHDELVVTEGTITLFSTNGATVAQTTRILNPPKEDWKLTVKPR
jgi:hypothetical protein